MIVEFSRVEDQIKRRYEQESIQLFEEYQSMLDRFKNEVSFDYFLSLVVTLKLGKIGLVNYIRRTKKEKSEVTIEERLEKEEKVLVCDLQPTSNHEEDKNQSTCVEDWTLSPKENKATSSLQAYADKDGGESPIEATNEEHMKIEEDIAMEIVKPAMLDQLQEGMG